jgi:16S rRNA (uracil1498-N3)-methyltransferase
VTYRIVIDREQKEETTIRLTQEQEHYLYRVVRLSKGDRFVALDGKGQSWLVQLTETAPTILESITDNTELAVNITLIVALPKNGFDEVVRCCTEIGVARIIPVTSDRTIPKPSLHKLQRWQKIAREAAEQAERLIVPEIEPVLPFSAAVLQQGAADCYIGVTRHRVNHLLDCLKEQKQNKIVMATGPEGGWTEKEIEQAIAAGFQPFSLGVRILRAVTAPIVALSLAAAIDLRQDRSGFKNLQD